MDAVEAKNKADNDISVLLYKSFIASRKIEICIKLFYCKLIS